MTLPLKKKSNKGIHYNCPIKNCVYTGQSAKNFYDHLKHMHNFMEFGDRP